VCYHYNMIAQCTTCKKDIKRSPSGLRFKRIYCSRECRRKTIYINCAQCGKQLRAIPSCLPRKKYCSERCKGLAIFNIPKNRENNIKSIPKGKDSSLWKGGSYVSKGYRIIGRKINRKQARILEHRLVMEKHIGRKLTQNEIVHHIDKNKLNNVISNLEVMTREDHAHLHYLDNLALRLAPYIITFRNSS